MENSRGYGGGSEIMDLLQNSNNSIWVHSSSSSSFHENTVNFDHDRREDRRAMLTRDYSGNDDDTYGEEFEFNLHRQSEKKRRLSTNQVQFLEKSFELENKLEPEKKVELAKELGLQPRQVAIWFQNRRARYKTKKLEKDYDSLKASYDRLKLDYDSLSKEKDDIQNEIKALTKKLKQREDGKEYISTKCVCHMDTTMPKRETHMLEKPAGLMAVPSINKQLVLEDANSTESDVVDSESSLCADANHYSIVLEEPIDQQSDFSHGEEEYKGISLPASPSPLLLLGCYDDPIASSCCNFSLVDDQPLLSWLC